MAFLHELLLYMQKSSSWIVSYMLQPVSHLFSKQIKTEN